jgi:erythronate-4-phosphate dehydrogenase
MPRIVADEAIGWVHEAFGDLGQLRCMPGHAITREAVREADVLLTRSVTRVDAPLLEGSSIRFVGSCTAGIDHVDLEVLRAHDVTFAHAPGCNARAVAEYVVTALHVTWAATPSGTPLGPIAVIGFGQVGRRVTHLLRTLGHDARVCDPPLREALGPAVDLDTQSSQTLLSIDEALEGARAVTLHVPLECRGPHPTVHLLDEPRLATLERGAIVVNTSRGSVVNDRALETWARATGGRAVLDVWEGEPNLLWSLLEGEPSPVALATPHIAGYTREGKARATTMVADSLAKWLERPPPLDAARLLGPPGAEPVDATAREDGRSTLASILSAMCPITEDDGRLRALAQRPIDERARGFETLRRTYALRRQFAHFELSAELLSDMPNAGLPCSLHDALSRLGVSIVGDPR